jgi:hypothetical protein
MHVRSLNSLHSRQVKSKPTDIWPLPERMQRRQKELKVMALMCQMWNILPTDVAVANDSDIEEQKDTDFVVDGIDWRVIEDEPGDPHLHVDEDNMYREVLDSEVAGRLRACIEKIDKRWRAVGANGGFYGTSRSSHIRREAENNLRSKSVKGDRKISTFYSKVSKDQNEASLSLSEEIAKCSSLLKKRVQERVTYL